MSDDNCRKDRTMVMAAEMRIEMSHRIITTDHIRLHTLARQLTSFIVEIERVYVRIY